MVIVVLDEPDVILNPVIRAPIGLSDCVPALATVNEVTGVPLTSPSTVMVEPHSFLIGSESPSLVHEMVVTADPPPPVAVITTGVVLHPLTKIADGLATAFAGEAIPSPKTLMLKATTPAKMDRFGVEANRDSCERRADEMARAAGSSTPLDLLCGVVILKPFGLRCVSAWLNPQVQAEEL